MLPKTLGESYDFYRNRAQLKSAHTHAAYVRSIELFFAFLTEYGRENKNTFLSRHQQQQPQDIALAKLSEEDTPLFLHFVEWMLLPGSGKDKRPYAPATIKLRLAGVQNWFQFMEKQVWLPATFSFYRANQLVQEKLRFFDEGGGEKVVAPTSNLEAVIFYYDTQLPPPALRKPDASAERLARWELIRLRNRALLHCLAESGGRISEILSLDVDYFGKITPQLEIKVSGKGGHPYTLHLKQSLPMIWEYLKKRKVKISAEKGNNQPLFISHDPRYEGSRMSRIVAWRVVSRAAKTLGLEDVSPQEFRHWRAAKLIEAGHSLAEVREILGHRSIETIRNFYGALENKYREEAEQAD